MTDSDTRDDHVLASETKAADGEPQWRLTKGEELEINPPADEKESVSSLLAECRRILDESPEMSNARLRALGVFPSPSTPLRRLKEWLPDAWRYRPERVLCVVAVLLLQLGIAGSALWLALAALDAAGSK